MMFPVPPKQSSQRPRMIGDGHWWGSTTGLSPFLTAFRWQGKGQGRNPRLGRRLGSFGAGDGVGRGSQIGHRSGGRPLVRRTRWLVPSAPCGTTRPPSPWRGAPAAVCPTPSHLISGYFFGDMGLLFQDFFYWRG